MSREVPGISCGVLFVYLLVAGSCGYISSCVMSLITNEDELECMTCGGCDIALEQNYFIHYVGGGAVLGCRIGA